MPALSVGVQLAWQIAANEAAHAKYQYIEIEHIFIGLCKAGDHLTPEALQQSGIDIAEANASRAEFERPYNVLKDFNIDRVQARRRLRGMMGQSDYEHTAQEVIHRSEKCKQFFARAGQIVEERYAGEGKIGAFPLLISILEADDTKIYELIQELGVHNIRQLRDALVNQWEEFQKCWGAFQQKEQQRNTQLAALMRPKVIGQDAAVEAVAGAIQRARASTAPSKRLRRNQRGKTSPPNDR